MKAWQIIFVGAFLTYQLIRLMIRDIDDHDIPHVLLSIAQIVFILILTITILN